MDKPMLYIDKVLSEWEKSGVTNVEEARAQHEGRTYVKPNAPSAQPAANPALDYEQRTETDYSGRIIDLSQYYSEDGDQT
jgi:DNA replication protein DnaD